MSNDTPIVITWHEENLAAFRTASNGSRNNTLNEQALKSFGLAKGDDNLSVSKVESDYTAAAKALQMDDSSIKATLASALSAASARDTDNNNAPKNDNPIDKSNLIVAPTYSALEDYAIAHGAPVEVFERAGWVEGEYKGRKCLIVPHEDGMKRVRFLDGEKPKWLPMGSGHKPCWYGFNGAVKMAIKSEHKTIMLCNGQPSVVVSQHKNIPALAQTDGEGAKITPPLLKRLLTAIRANGLKIILAYDGDDTGRSVTDTKKSNNIRAQMIANKVNYSVVNFGGDEGFDLADYCKLHKKNIMVRLQRLAAYSNRTSQRVLSRAQLAGQVRGIVTNPQDNIPPGELLVVPFKSFHHVGGYAHILEPGKMSEILAPSGGGKTSFMETWNDIWNMKGIDTMWFSPEWTPLQLQYRAIQRYSGITTDTIRSHVLWEYEAKRGIPESQRMGVQMSKGSKIYNDYLETNTKLAGWPGMAYIFQGQRITEEILEDMTKKLYELRRGDRRVGCAFFDYAQIMNTETEQKSKNSYEVLCNMIKDWCAENSIHAFVGSQPTQTVADACIQNGKILDKYDSMWVSPAVFNFIVTLNIKYNKIGDDLIKTDYAMANIAKNNEGQEKTVRIRSNFKYLSWMEETRITS